VTGDECLLEPTIDMKQLFILATVAALVAAAGASLAADGAPGKSLDERKARFEQWCKENPEKCREVKANAEQWREMCRADPEKCRAELQARREQWCKENPEKCRELKAKAQQRRDECKADPEKCRAEREALEERRFKSADANGDGRLTLEEARKGMPAVARNFGEIDANKDGAVTLEELRAARTARTRQRK
jgi:EF hand domain-containing protein